MRSLVLLALVGCGGSSPPTSPAASPAAAQPVDAAVVSHDAACAVVAAKLIAFQGDRMFQQLPADVRATWTPRIEDVFATSCREDGWPDAVITCSTAATDGPAIDACGDLLGPELEQKVTARLQPVLSELMASLVPPSEGPAVPSGIPACDQYIAALERYLSCGKLTPANREALTANLTTLRAAFARGAQAPAGKKQEAAATCAQADAALRTSAANLGCPL
jgi:hypothetical protein